MRKNRIIIKCKICERDIEIRPCEIGVIVTCSKECSLQYRSLIHKGRNITWGKKISESSKGCDFRYVMTQEIREKLSANAIKNGFGKSNKGKKLTTEHRKKISIAQTGHKRSGWKLSEECCKNRYDKAKKGEKSNFWKGGVTKINAAIRSSYDYKKWRRCVFERDNFTCVLCGARGCVLHADHIKPFAYYPELRFNIINGRTLCVKCHKDTDTYLSKSIKYIHGADIF